MGLKEIKKLLRNILAEEFIIENVPMAQHTSFKAGGHADMMVIPQEVEDLKVILELLAKPEFQYPFMVLGNGSNVLVRDGGYHGIIVKMGEAFDYVIPAEDKLLCGAGTLLSVAAKEAAVAGLEGMEFASGIPGSIGGAVFMNAGAYGGEMAHVLDKVHVVAKDGSRDFYMTAEELQMGYRHTLLHETGGVVTDVVLKLTPGNREAIQAQIIDYTKRRNAKQPVSFPSAGSFFKRPEGYFAGKLIQDAGLKGLTVGGAQVSELHSGFIINRGGATATDILQLKEIVQAKVMDEFGVMLEPEVRIIGEQS